MDRQRPAHPMIAMLEQGWKSVAETIDDPEIKLEAILNSLTLTKLQMEMAVPEKQVDDRVRYVFGKIELTVNHLIPTGQIVVRPVPGQMCELCRMKIKPTSERFDERDEWGQLKSYHQDCYEVMESEGGMESDGQLD